MARRQFLISKLRYVRGSAVGLDTLFLSELSPTGGYLCEIVEVVSGNVPVIGHAMMPAAAGQKVPIIKPQIESLFQRFNMMYRQLLIQTRNAIDTIAALVTDPAQVIIPTDNLVSLLCQIYVFRKLDVFSFRWCACFGF